MQQSETAFHRRFISSALELIPFLAFAFGSDDLALAGVVALMSGIGWLYLGRWDVAVVVWISRLLLLLFAGFVALSVGFFAMCDGCSATPAYVGYGILITVFITTTLASAVLIAFGKTPWKY